MERELRAGEAGLPPTAGQYADRTSGATGPTQQGREAAPWAGDSVIRVAVQHRDQLIRLGLSHVLGHEPDIEVVGGAATGAQLSALCAETRPDVALIQLDAPGEDVAHLVTALRKCQRTMRVVGVHDGLSAAESRRVHHAGVRHSVSYDMGAGSVAAMLRASHLAPSVNHFPSVPAPVGRTRLTGRERDVLNLVAAGRLSKDIAGDLDISVKTVENHKQRVFRKLGVQNQAHAVSVALRQGLLKTPAANA